jgi:hypothetical protein
MSGSYATNTVKEVTNVMTKIAFNATQICQADVTDNQNITITNSGNINIGSIVGKQIIITNIKCAQSDTVQNQINNDISETSSQIANAITQALSITPSESQANNVGTIITNLGTQISETFTQKCVLNLQNNQTLDIQNNAGANLVIGSIDFEQDVNNVIQCIQQDSAVNDLATQLKVAISQSATAKEDSLIGALVFILLILLVVVIVLISGGVKALTNWKFLLVLFIIILVYLFLAYKEKWWPFKK